MQPAHVSTFYARRWNIFSLAAACFATAPSFAASAADLSRLSADVIPLSSERAISAVSTAVITSETLAFTTGYDSRDWSGVLIANKLSVDGSAGTQVWDAGAKLDTTSPASRIIFTAKLAEDGSFAGGVLFKNFSDLDNISQVQLMTPTSIDAIRDSGQTRLDWLRGDRTSETNGTLRRRSSLLGAIIHSQALYVSNPHDGYRDTWPALANGTLAPESTASKSPLPGSGYTGYEQFEKNHATRRPVVYMAANDGMLHAFDASQNVDGSNTATSGAELWAYVPRSAYGSLGNLSRKADFSFASTVDATPVVRDVFFATAGGVPTESSAGWHTLLVGGLRQGGRGIYALDVTDPDPTKVAIEHKILWEFNASMPEVVSAGTGSGGANPGGDPSDLGYTYAQPNIARLANGRWVVLLPSGYFPDCAHRGLFSGCDAKSTRYSANGALFVLDAQTGILLAELKTPATIPGVASQGLSSLVLGDYNDDQVDDVAFAGDVSGNLWRFDLTDPNPANWQAHVTLAYQPAVQGTQPITVMPRLFADPVTNRFIVVFGTGAYAEVGNTGAANDTQAVYGIRDIGKTIMGIDNLVAQTLTEKVVPGVHCSDTLRGLTSNVVPSSKDGWYFNLISPGERVVVTPGALFDTNRAVITTLIPGSQGCSGNRDGATMIVDATTGGAGDGLSITSSPWSVDTVGIKLVGGHINDPPDAGTLPVSALIGGGKLIFPGVGLNGGAPLTANDAIWRRRSWRELMDDL